VRFLKQFVASADQSVVVLLPFIIFGIGFAALVAWILVKGRADRRARIQTLFRMGFAPFSADAETLAEQVARFENNSEYRYRVEDPLRASLAGGPVWFYIKERARQGHVVTAHEFRFRLDRDSSEGLVLFFKPSALRPGTSATLIGSLATSGWDSQPDDLTRLEVPVELRQSNLIGILAPANASLFELIDSKDLAALQSVADFGILVVTCRGGWCSFANSTTRMDLDLERLWPLIQQLTSAADKIHARAPIRE